MRKSTTRQSVSMAVHGVLSTTRTCKRDHSAHLVAYHKALESLGPMPRYMREYAQGVADTLIDALYRSELVFGAWIDGVFYSTHSTRPDYYGKHGLEPSFYAAASQDLTGHYWASDVSKAWYRTEAKAMA